MRNFTGILVKISELPSADPLTGVEAVPLVQDAETRRAPAGDFSDAIPPGTITDAQLADMAANTVKGRLTSLGVPQDLTQAQLTTLINAFTDALKGVVPASGGGTANFLRADGTWAAPGSAVPQVAVLFKGNQDLASVGDAINIPTVAVAAAVGDQFIIEGSARFTGVAGGSALAVQLRDVADTTLLYTLFDILGANGTNQIYFRHLITITATGPLVGTVGGMAVATGGTPSLDSRANAGTFTGLTAAAFQYRVELAGVVGNCQLNNLVMYRVTGP